MRPNNAFMMFVLTTLLISGLACNSGSGGQGTPAKNAPAAPTNLTAVAVSSNGINLTWTDASDNEDGFTVERSADGISYSDISGLVSSNTTTYADIGLTTSTHCYYRVRATNSIGDSAYSNSADAATLTIRLPKTGQTASVAAGDDGELQKGLALPDPRFTPATSGTGTVVTDNLTGLVWASECGTPAFSTCADGPKSWQDALDYVSCLNTNGYLGRSDWRLPNVNEMESLVVANQSSLAGWLNTQGFNNVMFPYWTSTTDQAVPQAAFLVYLGLGYVSSDVKTQTLYVLPVRGEGVDLPRSGQIACYDSSSAVSDCAGTGQDGGKLTGSMWPDPRFIVGAGTEAACATDSLTGLMWLKTLDTTLMSWQESLDYAASLNNGAGVCGHTDWRLPNANELHSLLDYSGIGPTGRSLTSGHPFVNVQAAYYWTSTTSAGNANNAWSINMSRAYEDPFSAKTSGRYAWPVRGVN